MQAIGGGGSRKRRFCVRKRDGFFQGDSMDGSFVIGLWGRMWA